MKNTKYHLNVGSASILLLIVVFALTVFAVLSIRASYNELQMAEKNRDSIEVYYNADAEAMKVYGQIAQKCDLLQSEDSGITEEAVQQLVSELKISEQVAIGEYDANILNYTVTADYNRKIEATVQLSENAKIVKWKLVSADYGLYEGEVEEVWDGQLNFD